MSARPDPNPRRARVRVGVGAALILVLAGLAVAVFLTAVTPHGTSSFIAPGSVPDSGAAGSTAGSSPPGSASTGIFVHILGQVTRPGLYQLQAGDRGVDAVAAAGGFTDTADPASLNLARLLVDGEQIIVPALGEAPAGGAGAVSADGVVDLNSADVAALETLPRIGPALAQRIIDWREANGRFSAVEDLLSVTGIGDATFAGLRDLVRV